MTESRPEPSAPLPEHALRKLLAVAAEGSVDGGDAGTVPPVPQDWLARLPARYTVRRELGRGGMGVVYLVEHPDTQAFLDMLVAERYRACAYHREAAIEDSRLVLITAGELNYLT